jgi:hypothetical protein
MPPLKVPLSKTPKDCYTLYNEQTKTMIPHDKLQPGAKGLELEKQGKLEETEKNGQQMLKEFSHVVCISHLIEIVTLNYRKAD